MGNILATALGLLATHADLILAVVQFVETGRLSKEAAIKALNDAATTASDLEMHREFPSG